MKQFDRPFLEQYRRNPRINSFYQNYYNPSAEGQYGVPVQPSVPNQFQSPAQSPMQQNNQVIERWPEQYQGLIPQSMQGMNSAQVLQELQKAYQGNQNLTNQRAVYNRNIEAEKKIAEQKGQEESIRLLEFNDWVNNYEKYIRQPVIGKWTPQTWKNDVDLRLVLATPNRSQAQANEALNKIYNNRYRIQLEPNVIKSYGIDQSIPPQNQIYTNPYK